jgi:hypothetical protein
MITTIFNLHFEKKTRVFFNNHVGANQILITNLRGNFQMVFSRRALLKNTFENSGLVIKVQVFAQEI